MVEIMGMETGFNVPTFSGGGGFNPYTLVIVAIFILILFAAAIGIWMFLNAKKYKYKIIVFENISGQGFQPTLKDRARLVKIGDGGEELLYLRKKKVYRTAYGKKMGKNTFWFAVGQDGYWYNILLGDLDAKMGMLDIEPIDRDMRYMHVAIRKNIQERYRKIGIMEKYGSMIFGAVFFIVMVVALWFLIDQIGGLMGEAQGVVAGVEKLIKPIETALSRVDTICSGGSGITPAG